VTIKSLLHLARNQTLIELGTKMRPFAKDIVGEPDHGGIDRWLTCSTSQSKPRSWMKWHQDSFAPRSLPGRDRRSRALDTRSCQHSPHWRGPNKRDWLNSIPTDRPL
jgi:hypothetical protein